MKKVRFLVLGVLALTAAVVASAAASGSPGLFMGGGTEGTPASLQASSYPATIGAERFEEGEVKGPLQVLSMPQTSGEGSIKVNCGEADFDGGQLYGPYVSFALGGPLGGSGYGECTSTFGATTVETKSCQYVYSGLEAGGEEGEYQGTVEIKCHEADGAIKLKMPLGCVVTIPQQTFDGQFSLLNREGGGEASVGLAMLGSGVDYSTPAKSTCSLVNIKEGTSTDGTMAVSLRLRA